MGVYENQVLPRVIDLMLGNTEIGKLRARAMEGLSGEVLEIGFGSGTNVPYYPSAITKVLAVDPSGTGRKMAAKRLAASSIPVEFIGLDGQSLPLADSSVDNALSTWTLCTIANEAQALAEIARVLRPGGRLYFLEHGLAEDARVAARQHRWNGVQQRVAGGCNMNRNHTSLIAASPLRLERVKTFSVDGPAALSFMYAGTAIKE